MRTFFSAKLITLTLALVFSYCIVSSLLGQLSSPRRGGATKKGDLTARSRQKSSTTSKTVSANRAKAIPNLAAQKGDVPTPIAAMFKLEQFDVAVIGREVGVSAKVAMWDTRAGVSFLWSLRVSDPSTKQTFLMKHYKNQIFNLTEGQANPTFEESETLLPGTYAVRLTLYEIPANFDYAKLKDEETEKAFRVVSGFKKVIVTP